MVYHKKPFYRHQIHEIPNPRVDITEYQLYSEQCQHCREVSRARLPEGAPQGIMGLNLLSYTAVLAGQYHLSVRKIHCPQDIYCLGHTHRKLHDRRLPLH
ncbi:hypothetical protein [Vibrio metschnikovii]